MKTKDIYTLLSEVVLLLHICFMIVFFYLILSFADVALQYIFFHDVQVPSRKARALLLHSSNIIVSVSRCIVIM